VVRVKQSHEVRSSLIVLNYQGAGVVEDCVRSLLASMSIEDELIVVDNASTDGSRQSLEAEFPEVVFVRNAKNRYIFGLNDGLAVARGRLVAFLNNDMTVDGAFVEECVAGFTAADIFAVCPRILEASGTDQGSRTRGFWHRGLLFYESLPHTDQPTNCFFAVGGQSFFRRDLLERIGSINELLWPMYHEDIELSYRAWKSGWRVVYAPNAVAHHLGGHTSKKVFSPTQLRSFVRQNELLTVWLNVTDRRMLLTHFALFPARLVTALAKRDWGTLRGSARALQRGPGVIRQRRTQSPPSVVSDRDVAQRISAIA
jgi:GT2 family glycosyltransferase